MSDSYPGWGGLNPAATEYPDKLMKIELPIVSDEQCQSEMTEKGWAVRINFDKRELRSFLKIFLSRLQSPRVCSVLEV